LSIFLCPNWDDLGNEPKQLPIAVTLRDRSPHLNTKLQAIAPLFPTLKSAIANSIRTLGIAIALPNFSQFTKS
jgi:hypothetical protein